MRVQTLVTYLFCWWSLQRGRTRYFETYITFQSPNSQVSEIQWKALFELSGLKKNPKTMLHFLFLQQAVGIVHSQPLKRKLFHEWKLVAHKAIILCCFSKIAFILPWGVKWWGQVFPYSPSYRRVDQLCSTLFLSRLSQGVWESCAYAVLYMEWGDASWETSCSTFLIAGVAVTLLCTHIVLPCYHLI